VAVISTILEASKTWEIEPNASFSRRADAFRTVFRTRRRGCVMVQISSKIGGHHLACSPTNDRALHISFHIEYHVAERSVGRGAKCEWETSLGHLTETEIGPMALRSS
jgi:hypothetical protein